MSTIASYNSWVAAKKPREDPGFTGWLTLLQAQSVVVDALERSLQAERGLPLAWFEVLIQLSAADDGQMKMQDLAQAVLLSKSGLTRLVDRMVAAGLVSRGACATDRRIVYAVVTDAGRVALREAIPVHTRALGEHFSKHLTPAELGMIRSTLTKVLDGNGFAGAPCPSLDVDAASADSAAVPR